MLSDFQAFMVMVGVCAITPGIVSFLLSKLNPLWSSRRVILFAALPIPTVIWLLCAYVFIKAAVASDQECGVDACAMAMMFSSIIAMATVVGLIVGLAFAWLARKFATR